jgi:endo-1,4-beta-xylanase
MASGNGFWRHLRLAIAAGLLSPATVYAEPQATKAAATETIDQLRSQLPANARLINDSAVSNWRINGGIPDLVAASDPIGGKAVSVVIPKAGDTGYAVTAAAPISAPISNGDTIFIAIRIRASSADNETQSGVISAIRVEEKGEPYTAIAESAAQVSDQWSWVYAAGAATQDYASGRAQISLHLASARQTIEIGNVYAFNLGPNVELASLPSRKITYPGREADAPWRTAADARIDAVRKSDIAVSVTNKKGQSIPGAKVRIEMLNHAFRFGAFVGHEFGQATDKAQKSRETFATLFNTATSPIYWQDWGWQSEAIRKAYLNNMQYLDAQTIPWRGHTLIYPGENHVPAYLKAIGDNKAAFTKAALDHVRNVANIAAKSGPFAFDVINEPRDGAYTIDRIGIDGVAEAFRIAHAAAPDAHLFVNEYGIISNGGGNTYNIKFYHEFLQKLIAAKAPLSGIGIQGHFGAVLTDPNRVYEIFNDFSRYNVPIQITEFDVDTNDEAAQADFTRDMLTIAFSHPSVEAFVTWGWWEGDHWRPAGAMMRKDWSPKPNYHAWRKRVFTDWWTDQTLVADAKGEAKLRGFMGDYKITVTNGKRTFTRFVKLTKAGLAVTVILP